MQIQEVFLTEAQIMLLVVQWFLFRLLHKPLVGSHIIFIMLMLQMLIPKDLQA
jgi:hypothetical protein